jgi:anti-sigma regulatory factor (Ser/Thr protein kinase)
VSEAGAPQTLARSFPAELSALFGVRTFLRERAAAEQFGPALTDDLVLAVSEASANAVLHSGSAMFRVSWLRERDRVVVEVSDDGEFKRRIPLGPPELGGRGIALIIALLDEVSIREGNPEQPGTVVRMTKYRSA